MFMVDKVCRRKQSQWSPTILERESVSVDLSSYCLDLLFFYDLCYAEWLAVTVAVFQFKAVHIYT